MLKLWEGLGYYNRVRNLQKAAQILMEEYGGEMPEDYEKVLALPGIGSYTAGAVLSISYGLPIPAVDGNVLRVISRIQRNDEDILKQSVKKKMETDLAAIMPKDRAGAFNQALMELGATVCVPNGPAKCEECPLGELCEAHKAHCEADYPKKAPKKPRKIEERTVLVIKDGAKAAIRRRPQKGLLAGLYELPNLPGHLEKEEVLRYLKEQNLKPVRILPLMSAKHIFSHVEWHMIGYEIRVEELEGDAGNGFLFVEPQRTQKEYPIPAAFAAYAEHLAIRLGQEKYQQEI